MIAAQFLQPGQDIDARRLVDDDVIALAPVGRYLQDRRTAQPPMREKQRLIEGCLSATDHRVDRNTRQLPKLREQRGVGDLATPGVEALWLAIKVARKSDQPEMEAKLLTQLRLLYPDSAEYAAYQRGVFDE